MGMPKGLSKATNYYNNLEAWRDWHKLANEVNQAGFHDLVVKYAPLETCGWRKVDKAIAALREAFQQKLHPTPESLATSQAVVNAETLSNSDGESKPAQARVS